MAKEDQGSIWLIHVHLENVPSEFNFVNSLVQGLGFVTNIDRTFTGTREQFWPDDLPAATTDSYGYQRKLNPGSLGASPSPLPLNRGGKNDSLNGVCVCVCVCAYIVRASGHRRAGYRRRPGVQGRSRAGHVRTPDAAFLLHDGQVSSSVPYSSVGFRS